METIQKQKIIKGFSYLTTKLAGASFLMLVMSIFLLLQAGMDMYEFVEGISSWFLWGVVFGYGILCSIIIDWLVHKASNAGDATKLIFYAVAGFGFFIIFGFNMYMVIAGTVGALSALVFYYGTYLSSRNAYLKYVFAVVVPVTLIILMNFDFTQKVEWNEVKNDSSYEATFEHFNGKHEIPVLVKEGETITVSRVFTPTNDGGHGFHMLNEENELVGMTTITDNKIKFTAPNEGVYRFVVKGNDVKGSFKVTWEIEGQWNGPPGGFGEM